MNVVSLAINLPGPAAARRLREFGAQVTKVEPPSGDPMTIFSMDWYRAMTDGQEIVTLNLKDTVERAKLDDLLAEADLLLTANRLRALQGLGLGWEALHARHPQLCHVAIVGYPDPRQDEPGHDLTYQAEIGLVQPPAMPMTLLADLHGAERAVSTALALLLKREHSGTAGYAEVALSDAAEVFTAPLHYGATMPGGVLGGGVDGYRLYEAKDGWVALAALEPVFMMRLQALLDPEPASEASIGALLGAMTVAEIEAWGRTHDIPVCGVNEKYLRAAQS